MNAREILGQAVAGREDSRSFWDCRVALAGRVFHGGAPGAVILNDAGHTLDLRSGDIYIDYRFAVTVPTKAQMKQAIIQKANEYLRGMAVRGFVPHPPTVKRYKDLIKALE